VPPHAPPDASSAQRDSAVSRAPHGFGGLWTQLDSSLVLAESSLASPRTFALLGVFAWFLLTAAIGGILSGVQREHDFMALSPFAAGVRIATWMFDTGDVPPWSLSLSWTSVASTILLSLLIAWWRVRRLEVVA
jgi:hypothetical protein